MRAFRGKAVAQGARYVTAEAVAVERQGRRAATVLLGDGHGLACDALVNAAGPWAAVWRRWSASSCP